MNLHHIFPTTVGITHLGRNFTKNEIEIFENLKMGPNEGNSTSLNRNVLELPKFKNLKKFITKSVNDYFQSVYCPQEKIELYVTQSWTNNTLRGQYHHKHAHPNSFISGVLYLNADSEYDKIFFHKDKYAQLDVSVKEWNLSNSESWWFEVATGKLIMFPSSLTHSVSSVETERTRVSLAFNTFFRGTFGNKFNLTELILK